MPLPFRRRLLIGLLALGTVPLAAALLTLAMYVRSTASPAGPRAALDAIALSDRQMIAALDTATLNDSARAAIRRHGETIGRRATLARRAEALSRAEAAALGVVVLAATLLLVGSSFWLVRRWSTQASGPVEELVEWTRMVERGEPLPPAAEPAGAPEFTVLRRALREMTDALEVARRQEVERERLRAFRETARRVAHELRGPLGASQLALHRLAETPGRDPNSQAALTVVREEMDRLKHMADEFAEFGRLPEGPVSDIDVTELLENVLTATVPSDYPVKRAVEPGLTIRGRYEPIRRAIQNVVLNAVQATDDRGITLRAHRNESAIICVIEDHGPGVPSHLRLSVFEPYVTTKPSGTGLGLAIAHQAVTAHNGTLTVQDAPGGGAAFTFTLPVSARLGPPST